MIKKSSIVNIDNNRIFIDIAKSGCGNDCKYCYIESANEPQQLWSKTDIENALKQLIGSQWFLSNSDKYIVSLCPSTEPLKTRHSRDIIKFIIKSLASYGCFFQIATKELVSTSFLKEINKLLLFEGQLQINISINNFTLANVIEPNAPKPKTRFNNILKIKQFGKIKSCVLIKPFISATYTDLMLFKRYLSEYVPDYICVGITFFKNHCINDKSSSEFFLAHFKNQDAEKISSFIRELSSYVQKPIFPSTLCIFNQIKTGFIVPNAHATLICSNCGKCIKNEF